MSTTVLWVAVLAACVLGFVTKYVGQLVPESVVDGPRRSRIIGLLPVALLAGLVVTQTAGGDDALVLDARRASRPLPERRPPCQLRRRRLRGSRPGRLPW